MRSLDYALVPPTKLRAQIMGVPVLGTGREALSVVDRLNRRKPVVEEIIIAMPSAELDRAAGEIAGV